jgi:hypothetical protein
MQPFDLVDYKKVPFYVYNMRVSLIDEQMIYHFLNKIHPLVTSSKEESVLAILQFLDRDDDAVLLLLFHRKVHIHILRCCCLLFRTRFVAIFGTIAASLLSSSLRLLSGRI